MLQMLYFTLAAGMVLRSKKYAMRAPDVNGATPAELARLEDQELVRPGFFAGVTWILQDITYTTSVAVVILFWLQGMSSHLCSAFVVAGTRCAYCNC
jgi:hypothetical protein